ncbi:MAG TPA: pyridoxamine 5'-phosphate oxidase family protein [Terracidiphilus sp.]
MDISLKRVDVVAEIFRRLAPKRRIDLTRPFVGRVWVTHVDGLVLARSAFNHSMNYRSVVAFGAARAIEDVDRKIQALRIVSEHMLAGRWADICSPNAQELKATTVLEFTIEEVSAKTRQGDPIDDEEDYSLPVWAGVVPLRLEAKSPIPDARLFEDVEAPQYVLESRFR